MRYFVLVFAVMLSTFAVSQSAGPGSYAEAFAPRVSTPSYSFPTPALQVGASNATEGNTAGASSMVDSPAASLVVPVTPAFNTGASMPQGAFGAAELASQRAAKKPAVRTFTNADVQQLHDAEPK
ncbi:MAG TPA: hypothetical protein VH088_24860 [Terriglobales bacterium]|jgi:hypothetical protein|nr:hypothetical protein [Terriglobales bacterium]